MQFTLNFLEEPNENHLKMIGDLLLKYDDDDDNDADDYDDDDCLYFYS